MADLLILYKANGRSAILRKILLADLPINNNFLADLPIRIQCWLMIIKKDVPGFLSLNIFKNKLFKNKIYISLIVFSRAFNICFYFFNLTNCSVPARTWKMVKILFFLSKSHFRAHTFYTNTCAYNNTRVGDKKYKKLHVLYYQLLRDSWSYWKIKNRYQKPKLWRIKQL